MAINKAVNPKRTLFEIIESSAPWSGASMMLYGAPGSGKTFLAGTAVQVPELQKVILFDNDGGSRTVRGKKEFDGIKIVRVHDPNSGTYMEVKKWLGGEPSALESAIGTSAEGYKTVIIDNLGAVHEAFIREILAKEDFNRSHVEVASLQDYGLARTRLRLMMSQLATLSERFGYLFIFTAHVDIIRTEYETIAKMRPAIAGKLGYEVPGDLPIVGLMEVESARGIGASKTEGGSRVIYFDPSASSKSEVKDQSQALGAVMREPSMPKIYARIKHLIG